VSELDNGDVPTDPRPVDLLADSLLWLINRTVFQPRGYALGYDLNEDAFYLVGEGKEPFVFGGDGSDEAHHLAKIKDLMP